MSDMSTALHTSSLVPTSHYDASKGAMQDPTASTYQHAVGEEALEAHIQRLGRQRPDVFRTAASEYFFVFSIVMSQFLCEYFVSGFTVIIPTLIKELGLPQASSVWPASAFSLAIASTLLIFGRLGDMLGGRVVFLVGLAWLLVWSIIAGISINPTMLIVSRALQGLGAAAFLPSGVMLMGSIYRPGPRKNLVFAVYGTLGILGFFGGIFVAGIVGQYLRWGFYFWIGAILTGITLLSACLSIRKETSPDVAGDARMDYAGAIAIVTGLILTIFALTQSVRAPQGWRTPYIPVCFSLGVLALLVAAYVENSIATAPLLPSWIFSNPCMAPLCVALGLLYGTWAVFSLFGTLYFQDVMMASPLQIVAWYVPTGVVGLLFAIIEGYVLHLVPGRVFLVISGLGALGSQLLIALMPLETTSYWPFIFPAMILCTIGIDVSTVLMTVFISTTFPIKHQGLAGGVLNSVLQLGLALTLGIGDIVQFATVNDVGLAMSFKYTFWLGVGAGGVALILLLIWGNVPKAKSELSLEERRILMLDESPSGNPATATIWKGS